MPAGGTDAVNKGIPTSRSHGGEHREFMQDATQVSSRQCGAPSYVACMNQP